MGDVIMTVMRWRFLAWWVAAISFSIVGCGNNPGSMLDDPFAGRSLPSANDLDGNWLITADAAGLFLGGCLQIESGRPTAFFDGCGFVDSLITSKPIAFDDTGPIIEFTTLDNATGLALDITIFATPRTKDFFDILFVGDDAINSVSIEGQMERQPSRRGVSNTSNS